MKKEYTYEVTENGYFIFIDGKKVIHQYEPYIPDKTKSYEENAKAQIAEKKESDEKASEEIPIEERVSALEDMMNMQLGF